MVGHVALGLVSVKLYEIATAVGGDDLLEERSDSYDNALAEAVNGLYKTELIRRRGPWRTIEQVELATLEYVWWWNNQRLHGELAMKTPLEVEAGYYAAQESTQPALAGQGNA